MPRPLLYDSQNCVRNRFLVYFQLSNFHDPCSSLPVVGAVMALDGVGGTVCNAQQYIQSLELRLDGNRGHSISSSCSTRGKCEELTTDEEFLRRGR